MHVGVALLLVSVAAVLVIAASPPELFGYARFLVLPGLALFCYAVATTQRAVGAVLFFAATYAAYAWSLRHVSLVGFLAIVFFAGLYGYLFARLWLPVVTRSRALALPAFAAAFCLVEALRAHMPGMAYQHGQVAQSFHQMPALLAPARFVGEAGCNFLFACIAADIDGVYVRGLKADALMVALPALVIAGAATWLTDLDAAGPPLSVALVQTMQPAYRDQAYAERLRDPEALYAHYAALARDVPPCDLALWPESALSGLFLVAGADEERQVQSLGPLFGGATSIVIGATRIDADTARDNDQWPLAYRNVAYLLTHEAERARVRIAGIHEKQRLVPLGEAIPFWLDWLRYFWPQHWRLAHGKVLDLPRLPDGRGIGVAICYENCFQIHFATEALRGAELFAVPSFEAWYRQGAELDQMLAMTVLRAIETGRPIVRATSDGVSCAVDGMGRVSLQLARNEVGVATVFVQPRRGEPWSLRIGAVLPYFFALLLVVMTALARRHGWRGRSERPILEQN